MQYGFPSTGTTTQSGSGYAYDSAGNLIGTVTSSPLPSGNNSSIGYNIPRTSNTTSSSTASSSDRMTGAERFAYNNYLNTQRGQDTQRGVRDGLQQLISIGVPQGSFGIRQRDAAMNNIVNAMSDGGLQGMAALDMTINTAEGILGAEIVNLPNVGYAINNVGDSFIPQDVQNKVSIDSNVANILQVARVAGELGGSLSQASSFLINQGIQVFDERQDNVSGQSGQGYNIVDQYFRNPRLANLVRYGLPELSTREIEQARQNYTDAGLDPSSVETDAGFLQAIGGFFQEIGSKVGNTVEDVSFAYQK